MVVRALTLSRFRAVLPVTGSHICFHPNDWFNPLSSRLFVKRPRAKETTMIRERESRHLMLFGFLHQVANSIGAV